MHVDNKIELSGNYLVRAAVPATCWTGKPAAFVVALATAYS